MRNVKNSQNVSSLNEMESSAAFLLETTCILCPNGCELILNKDGTDYLVEGNKCKRGIQFAIEEYTDPKRVLTTTVRTNAAQHPRLSVKTTKGIPKGRIFEAMKVINQIEVASPIQRGQILYENLLNLGLNVVATETLNK